MPSRNHGRGPVLAFNPAVRVLWRSAHEVQLELGAEAMVVEGLDSGLVRALLTPGGDASVTGRVAAGRPVLQTLVEANYLWPMPADPSELLAPPHPRLAGELTALALSHGRPAVELLAARRDRIVLVLGDSVLAPLLGRLLAAAGIGWVHHAENRRATLAHQQASPTAPDGEGRPLSELTARSIESVAPEVRTGPVAADERPDLVVLAYDGPIDPDRADLLHIDDQPYLGVGVGAGTVTVGPLVVPGLSACLACVERHRADRDPAWPALAAQLQLRAARTTACPGWLITAGAAYACGQALAYLDGHEVSVLDASIELGDTEHLVRRRSWPVHPECTCRA